MTNVPFICPVCKLSKKAKDKSEQQTGEIIRTVTFKCGTIVKLIQGQFGFRHRVDASDKCVGQAEQAS